MPCPTPLVEENLNTVAHRTSGEIPGPNNLSVIALTTEMPRGNVCILKLALAAHGVNCIVNQVRPTSSLPNTFGIFCNCVDVDASACVFKIVECRFLISFSCMSMFLQALVDDVYSMAQKPMVHVPLLISFSSVRYHPRAPSYQESGLVRIQCPNY